MIFLTYNDLFSGIYKSQVIDVVKYLSSITKKEEVQLVALVSLRSFRENRAKIKSALPASIVLPMFPGVSSWKMNYFLLFLLFLIKRPGKVICRGPFSAYLSIWLKKSGVVSKVIFDARGAYTAEVREYNVIPVEKIKNEISEIEEFAVKQSDFRIAVSTALVDYWRKNFHYENLKHAVIPCTLSSDLESEFSSEENLRRLRSTMGYSESDVVFVYSGSSAQWQSFELVDEFVCKLMDKNPYVKLLVLSPEFKNHKVLKEHTGRVKTTWVKVEEVKSYLLLADYGILFRENTVTNQVASPVKFAEYLSCGLKVLISENLGDYSDFSEKMDLRYKKPERVAYAEKVRIHRLCMTNFLKEGYKNNYLEVLNC